MQGSILWLWKPFQRWRVCLAGLQKLLRMKLPHECHEWPVCPVSQCGELYLQLDLKDQVVVLLHTITLSSLNHCPVWRIPSSYHFSRSHGWPLEALYCLQLVCPETEFPLLSSPNNCSLLKLVPQVSFWYWSRAVFLNGLSHFLHLAWRLHCEIRWSRPQLKCFWFDFSQPSTWSWFSSLK